MEKFRKPAIIIIAIVIVLALVNVFTDSPEPQTPTTEVAAVNIDFNTATYEEKQAWLEQYLKADHTTINMQLDKAIKEKFNYPKTVDFNFGESPFMSNGRIVDADTGTVFIEGNGTSENAFKQESDFSYSVRLKINDKETIIDNISIQEN